MVTPQRTAPGRALVLVLMGRGGRLWLAAATALRRLLLSLGWLRAAIRSPRLQRRLPFVLRRWHALLGSLLALKLGRAAVVGVARVVAGLGERPERRRLRAAMLASTSYEEWAQAAVALDELSGRACRAASPRQERSRRQLEQRAAVLARLREAGDTASLALALRLDYLRQAGSASTSALVEAAGHCPVLPEAVQRYIGEVQRCLRHIVACPELPLDDRLAFLRELRHAYGRTGLVLSGGGSFGFWHFGVVRALLDTGLLPRVVSGSSAGSIGGALLCTRTDEELAALVADFPATRGLDFFRNSSQGALVRHLLAKGTIQDHDFFAGRLRRLLGDLTFLDAYQRSGRILSIAVTAHDTNEPSRLLNYLTAPNVLIWSAVACSSAFPFLFAPQELLAKDASGRITRFSETGAAQRERRWCDGSLEEDLPMRGLSQLFGVNFFIASQANPWIIPIVALKALLPPGLGRLLESEWKHRCGQLLKIWPGLRLLKMLCQPWEGDVTVALPATAFSVGKAALNFSQADIVEAMRHGQRAVWAKLPAIQAACAIEFTIDQLLQQVTLQAQQEARLERAALKRRAVAGGLRGSLPSWLHMPSLGLPNVDSEASLATARPDSAASVYADGSTVSGSSGSGAGSGSVAAERPAPDAHAGGLRALGGSRGGSSRGGSRQENSAEAGGLRDPLEGAPDVAAATGVEATVGQLAAASAEAAAEALSDLEPGTPAAQQEEDGSPGAAGGRGLFESAQDALRDLMVLSAAAGGQAPRLSLDALPC